VDAVIQQGDTAASRRLSDVSRAHPGDVTLQNLLGVLVTKLDSCRRLPIFEYEAGSEGHAACAKAFRELADAERESVNQLLTCLQQHLVDTAQERNGVRS
jgi:rubrerythrin